MKAIAFTHCLPATDPAALQDIELPQPHPGPHDLLVRVQAVSVNPIDTKVRRNLTEDRINKLTAVDFAALPLQDAFTIVRGNGKRKVAVFEDPNCGYCKKLAKDIAKLDNVTIYTFLLPILSPDSLEKSNQIWCSTDKAKTWNDWMQDGKAPSGKADCDTTAVQKTIELGRRLSINGTPTLFFADGERIPGAVPIAQIEQRLAGQTTK